MLQHAWHVSQANPDAKGKETRAVPMTLAHCHPQLVGGESAALQVAHCWPHLFRNELRRVRFSSAPRQRTCHGPSQWVTLSDSLASRTRCLRRPSLRGGGRAPVRARQQPNRQTWCLPSSKLPRHPTAQTRRCCEWGTSLLLWIPIARAGWLSPQQEHSSLAW